jgi:MoaA/NifB/PqqE/SkfB family radical SAM enzyme
MHRLPEIAEIARAVGTKMWSLFFLIVTGRAEGGDDLLAEEYEKVFEFMYELSKSAPFGIKTTEAMHYRRYVAQRMKVEHRNAASEAAGAVVWRTAGVSDGKGFVLCSQRGDLPSGFLPLNGGMCGRIPDRCIQEFRTGSDAADTTQREGKWDLRISENLWRFLIACLRADGELPGRRSRVRLSAGLAEALAWAGPPARLHR